MLLLALIAQSAPPSDGDASTIIAALGALAVGIAAIITALNRRRKNGDEDEVVDPITAVREHVAALENALRTAQSGERDALAQRDDCRTDRDRYKAERDLTASQLAMKTAQYNLALTQIGDLERQLAEAKRHDDS